MPTTGDDVTISVIVESSGWHMLNAKISNVIETPIWTSKQSNDVPMSGGVGHSGVGST